MAKSRLDRRSFLSLAALAAPAAVLTVPKAAQVGKTETQLRNLDVLQVEGFVWSEQHGFSNPRVITIKDITCDDGRTPYIVWGLCNPAS
jgi:hypothetical protein